MLQKSYVHFTAPYNPIWTNMEHILSQVLFKTQYYSVRWLSSRSLQKQKETGVWCLKLLFPTSPILNFCNPYTPQTNKQESLGHAPSQYHKWPGRDDIGNYSSSIVFIELNFNLWLDLCLFYVYRNIWNVTLNLKFFAIIKTSDLMKCLNKIIAEISPIKKIIS